MDAKLKIVFLLAFSTANAGLIAIGPKILEGPSTRTILVGPDGSQISAILPGGRIVLEEGHGPLLQAIPEVVAIPSIAQPVPIPVSTGAIGDISVPSVEVPSVDTEIKTDVETVSVDSAVVEAKSAPVNATEVEVSSESKTPAVVSSTEASQVVSEDNVQVVESSSNNATSSESSSEVPASTTESPKEGVKSAKDPVGTPGDIEGKYVPDNLEKLFDDGSYKPSEFLW